MASQVVVAYGTQEAFCEVRQFRDDLRSAWRYDLRTGRSYMAKHGRQVTSALRPDVDNVRELVSALVEAHLHVRRLKLMREHGMSESEAGRVVDETVPDWMLPFRGAPLVGREEETIDPNG